MTKEEAQRFAEEWVSAWNAHDLDRIMSHYDDAVELISPVAAQLLGAARVQGKENLKAYFQRGLKAFPTLRFELDDVLWGVGSVVLYYVNHKGTQSAEFMEFTERGKVVRVIAHYNE